MVLLSDARNEEKVQKAHFIAFLESYEAVVRNPFDYLSMAHGWLFVMHQVDLWRPSFEQKFVLHASVVEYDCDNLEEGARINLDQCFHVVQLRYYI